MLHRAISWHLTSPPNLKKGCWSDGGCSSTLESFLYMFVFFYLAFFLLFVATRTPWCYSLTFLPLSFFFLSPYLPSMQFVLLYNRFTIVAKSARAPWVCSIGTSLSLQHWDKPRGFKNNIALGVFIIGQQHTQSAHPSHEVWQQSRGVFFSSPCLCVFVFAYISCHHHHLHVVVGTKVKMWRWVKIKKVGALPTPLSSPFVFILSMVCLILLLLPLPCLCCVGGTKVKGSCWQ